MSEHAASVSAGLEVLQAKHDFADMTNEANRTTIQSSRTWAESHRFTQVCNALGVQIRTDCM